MKRILCILAAAIALTGCSEKKEITMACEKGFECDEIKEAVKEYYGSEDIVVTEVDSSELLTGGYTVSIGSVLMGDSLDYGLWKSKPIKHECAAVVSRDEYRASADLTDVKLGIPKDFEYVRFITVPEDCEVETYSDRNALISDLKEGVIGAIICSDSVGGEIAAAVDGARINTIIDSRIYEYVVISEDIDLINSLDTVIE